MPSDAVLNIRLPKSLKEHGNQVLSRNGVSVSKAVRRLYEYMEREQALPDVIADAADVGRCNDRRRLLREIVGVVDLPSGFDARQAYRDHLVDKYERSLSEEGEHAR